MKTVTATPSLVLPLGRMGENEYTRIQFDVSGWLNELPAATIGLYNQRPQDADAYPVDGITVENGIVTWTITSAELAQVGKGRCELVAIKDSVVAKSAIYNTIIFDALDGSGEAPDPWDSWQQTFVTLKAEAVAAAEDAETAAEHYPRIVDGIWQVWDVQTEGWVSTGVHATGEDGQDGADGVSPTVSVTDISGGHRVTITDAEGQHTFDVLNGEDGTDGTDGQDGFSPTASVTQTATGATISITDKTGTTTANIENGTDGVTDVQVNGSSVVNDGYTLRGQHENNQALRTGDTVFPAMPVVSRQMETRTVRSTKAQRRDNMKHIGTDKEPNTAEADVIDEVWVRDEHDKLVKQEVAENDAEAGQ